LEGVYDVPGDAAKIQDMTEIFNKTSEKIKRQILRHNSPGVERLLWSKLRDRQLSGYRFRRQYGIDRYVVDFYCPALKLAVEIDGDSHFRDNAPEYDKQRQQYIEALGIRFLRFTNEDVRMRFDQVIDGILAVVTEFETSRRS
jgi:very-short-patch-repair endonuclease